MRPPSPSLPRVASISRSTSTRDRTLGSGRPSLGEVERARRIVVAHPFREQEAEELPDHRQPARHGARRHADIVERFEVGAQRLGVGTGRLLLAPCKKSLEVVEIGAVGGERVARGAALGLQHLEEGLDLPRPGGRGLLLHRPLGDRDFDREQARSLVLARLAHGAHDRADGARDEGRSAPSRRSRSSRAAPLRPGGARPPRPAAPAGSRPAARTPRTPPSGAPGSVVAPAGMTPVARRSSNSR